MATEKQVNFALILLDKAGYSTRYMNAGFSALGALCAERTGEVSTWLRNMDVARCSSLIETLKKKVNT